ncbi:MAG: hypothetical protein JO312_02605 [Hyphomicrobiales bacterium]|nr:hypothetical protein [Hyphomicrobiales bacterium]
MDHHNTGHPHSHVVMRGKDDLGKDLIIAQDYITDGVLLRAQERATAGERPGAAREASRGDRRRPLHPDRPRHDRGGAGAAELTRETI